VALVCEQTKPNEGPPFVGEVNANFSYPNDIQQNSPSKKEAKDKIQTET
jgi:hypothetical protein